MTTTGTPDGAQELWTIEPRRSGFIARMREVWRYRKLLRFFGSRALQKLYRNTVLGMAWIFIRPLFPLLVNNLLFGRLLQVETNGVPYFLFLTVGSTIWELFAQSAMWATRSLQLNAGIISRIYVPRLIIPIAGIAPALVNFGIHILVMIGALIYYRVTQHVWYIHVGPELLWVIPSTLLTLTIAIGLGLWTSVPAAVARDVRFTLAYVLGFWVLATPVMYPLSAISPRWQMAMAANPMTAPVEMFKAAILGSGEVRASHIAVSVAITLVLAGSGLWFFGRAEAEAADRV